MLLLLKLLLFKPPPMMILLELPPPLLLTSPLEPMFEPLEPAPAPPLESFRLDVSIGGSRGLGTTLSIEYFRVVVVADATIETPPEDCSSEFPLELLEEEDDDDDEPWAFALLLFLLECLEVGCCCCSYCCWED